MKTQIIISIIEKIIDNCPIYETGDKIIIKKFYIDSQDSQNICIHAFAARTILPSAFSHGPSSSELGISSEKNAGYFQCPDTGLAYTKGGTVLFNLKRVATK